jgi:hypothetical protein
MFVVPVPERSIVVDVHSNQRRKKPNDHRMDVCVQPSMPKASLESFQAIDIGRHERVVPEPKTGEMKVVVGSKTRIAIVPDDASGVEPAKEFRNKLAISRLSNELQGCVKESLVVFQIVEHGSVDIIVGAEGCDVGFRDPRRLKIGIVIESHVVGVRLKLRKALKLSAEEAAHENIAFGKSVLHKEILVSVELHGEKLLDTGQGSLVGLLKVLVEDVDVDRRKHLTCNSNRCCKNVELPVISKDRSNPAIAGRGKIDDTPRTHLFEARFLSGNG